MTNAKEMVQKGFDTGFTDTEGHELHVGEIDNHCVLPVRDSRGRTIDGTGENGKTATVVQVEGSNILLITERYANGIRVASCWNTQKRRYGLQEHDDYIFVRKDGSVTHKLSRDVFVFPKTKRA